jgi:hypothetical protein
MRKIDHVFSARASTRHRDLIGAACISKLDIDCRFAERGFAHGKMVVTSP